MMDNPIMPLVIVWVAALVAEVAFRVARWSDAPSRAESRETDRLTRAPR